MNQGRAPENGVSKIGSPSNRRDGQRAGRSTHAAFEAEVTARLGVSTNAFRVHDGADETVRSLWAFAKSAYLANPLPTLFKERLFVHLSRFCPWRYCVARHAGFLLGRGHPAGDPLAPLHTPEEVAALLSGPGRLRGTEFEAALARLDAMPGAGVPEPASRAEADIFAAATEVFLELDRAEAAREALLTALGGRNLDLLHAFLAFVRAIHHWTSTRRTETEEDVEALLREHEELTCLIGQAPQAENREVAEWRHERNERAPATRSAEMLRLALDAADQGTWDHDFVTAATIWDGKACELFGRPAEASLSCEPLHDEIIHPDDRARARKALNAAMDPRGDGRYVAEYRVILPERTTRWLSVSGRTLFEGEGHERRPVRMLGTVRDVTEHVSSQQRLRKSEERLAAAVKGGKLGIYDYDPRSGQIDWDETTSELWGVPPEEPVTFEMFAAGLHPDDLPAVEAALRAAFDPWDERTYAAEYRVINRQTGETRWVRATGDTTFKNGTAVRLVGTVVDITRQKAAENRLRESETRLKRLLDQLFAYVGVLTPEGIILHANRAPLEAAGIALVDVINRPIEDTYPFAYDDGVRAQVRDAVRRAASGEVVRYDFLARIAGRALLMVDFQISPMLDEEDHIVGLIASGTNINERVKVERTLQRREERLTAVLRAANLGSWHWNLQTGVVEMNSRWAGILGYDFAELEQRYETFARLLHPDDMDRVQKALKDHFEGHTEFYSLEIRMRHKDGHWVWILTSGRLVERDRQGQPLIMTGTHLDISERVAAEQAVREREELFRNTFENAAVGIAHVGLDGSWLRVNGRLGEIVGYSREELLRMNFQAITYPDDLEPHLRQFEVMIRGQTTGYKMHKRYFRKNGEIIWVNLTVSLQRNELGLPAYCICIIEDITVRKRAEKRLREREEQFRLLADNISQLAWMTDATGWIHWYNKRWFDYTGTTLEEMQGWGWTKVHHPDHVDRVVKSLSESIVYGKPWEDTFPLRSKDGEYRWFLSRALPIRDHEGRIVRWFGTNTDITERRRAETHRELLINELNHRVKNTLAIVQGIARQTFTENGPSTGKLTKTFQSRLAALAAAHNLLTRSSWESATLNEVACEVVASACAPNSPVHLKGPEIVLRPKQAITFAMAFHELCTNAVKHGALSSERGGIEVNWWIVDGSQEKRLKLVWREHGGPRAMPPPRRGFGLRMIEQALAVELNGRVRTEFRPKGLVCTIEGTLEHNGKDLEWMR